MGGMLQIPLRDVLLRLRVTMVNFDGDVVLARGVAGSLTLEMEIGADVWEVRAGSLDSGTSIEVALV